MAQKIQPSVQIAGLKERAIGDFWSWAYSDLLCNTVRPLFAEYIVGECLGITQEPRKEWDSVDLKYRGRGVEVKSSGYVQTWQQRQLSKISFEIALRKNPWDADSN